MGDKVNFGKALEHLKNGDKVTRPGWNGKGLHVELQRPDSGSKMTLPYLVLVNSRLDLLPVSRVPWHPSQTDILAEDWNVIPKSQASSTDKKAYAYRHRKGHLTYLEHDSGTNQFIKREPSSDRYFQ